MVRRRGPDPETLDVELVEDTDAVGTHGTGASPDRGPASVTDPAPLATGTEVPSRAPHEPARRRRARHLAPVLVGTVLVVGMAVAQVLESSGSPTAGVVEGRIGPVPEAPEMLWQADGSFWFVAHDDVVAHGTRDGGLAVRDLRTGDVLAERPEAEVGLCDPPQPGLTRSAGPPPVVLCVRGPAGSGTTELTAVSVRDGSELWRHSAPATGWSSTLATAWGDEHDVIWAVENSDEVRLARLAVADGTVRWSTDHEVPGSEGLWVQVLDDVVVVNDSVVVDVTTGRAAAGAREGTVMTAFEVPAPRGAARFVATDSSSELVVVDEHGTERFTVADAQPVGWGAVVSDRAAEVAVFLLGGHMAVLDVVTGEELWRPRQQGTVVAYLPDVLVLSSPGRLHGVDPRTGEERWSVADDSPWWSAAAVDDRRLVVPAALEDEAGPAGFPVPGLQAIDLETGDVVWAMPVPGPVSAVGGTADVMLVQTESVTVAYATR